MATIRKRNGAYQIRVSAGYDIHGKQIIKTKTFKPSEDMTPKQIEKELNRQATLFEEKVKSGLVGNDRQMFSDYCRYVLELKERNGLKRATLERYESFLEHIDNSIGHIKLGDLKPKHLNDLYKKLSQDGMNKTTGGKLSNKTILEHHRFISSVLAQAEKELLIPFNPAKKSSPPRADRKEVNYFQVEVTQHILKCLENEPLKYKLLTMLLMTTGCRRGEILGLKWGKIDKNTQTLCIDNNILYSSKIGIYETTTKTGKARKVKIPLEVVELLIEYQKEFYTLKYNNGDLWQGSMCIGLRNTEKWIENDYVFVQDNGKPMHPDSITDWLNKFSKRHNLPHINPHAFRHTVASILIMQGVDVVTVSKQLGHEKVSTTTDIYSHIMERANEKVVNTISDVIFQKQA